MERTNCTTTLSSPLLTLSTVRKGRLNRIPLTLHPASTKGSWFHHQKIHGLSAEEILLLRLCFCLLQKMHIEMLTYMGITGITEIRDRFCCSKRELRTESVQCNIIIKFSLQKSNQRKSALTVLIKDIHHSSHRSVLYGFGLDVPFPPCKVIQTYSVTLNSF